MLIVYQSAYIKKNSRSAEKVTAINLSHCLCQYSTAIFQLPMDFSWSSAPGFGPLTTSLLDTELRQCIQSAASWVTEVGEGAQEVAIFRAENFAQRRLWVRKISILSSKSHQNWGF